MESKLENDHVCGIHFHSGNAASLWDKFNPDWLPSLHMGHSKLKHSDQQKNQQERAQRTTEDVNARGNMRNRIKLLKKKCLGKMNQEPTEIGDEHPLLRSDFISVGAGTTYTRITG